MESQQKVEEVVNPEGVILSRAGWVDQQFEINSSGSL